MKPLDLAAYRKLFPSADELIWLSHAGISPVCRPVTEAMDEHVHDVLDYAAAHIPRWTVRLKRL